MNQPKSNIDWKSYAIMAGISLGVYVVARLAEEYAVKPMLAKAKETEKSGSDSEA